jgi:hypothetical protein
LLQVLLILLISKQSFPLLVVRIGTYIYAVDILLWREVEVEAS